MVARLFSLKKIMLKSYDVLYISKTFNFHITEAEAYKKIGRAYKKMNSYH